MRRCRALVAALLALAACSKDKAGGGPGQSDGAGADTGSSDQGPSNDGSGGGGPDGGGASGPDGAQAGPPDAGLPIFDGSIPEANSGTRIHALVVTTADGARQLTGWYDTQLGTACGFLTASDGMLRCLPLGANALGVFADDRCMLPAVALNVDRCRPLPLYATYPASTACTAHHEVHRVRTSSVQATKYFVSPTSGSCLMVPLQGKELHLLEPEMSPSGFVGGHTSVDSAPGRLATMSLVADDGAQAKVGWFDTTMAGECTALTADDGTLRCLPEEGAVDTPGLFFSDMQCMHEVAAGLDTACHPSSPFIYQGTADGCGTRIKVSTRGAEVPLASAYTEMMNMMCVPEAPVAPSGLHLYQIGALLAAASFPGLQTSLGMGTGRLKERIQRADDGIELSVPGIFVDSSNQATCSFSGAGDGRLRCLPAGPLATVFFADSTCTASIAIGVGTSTCVAMNQFVRTIETTREACGSRTRIFTAGATMSPDNVFIRSNGLCSQIAAPNFTFIGFGNEVEPSTFQEGTIEVQ